jgi:peptidylprolyl isomerase
MPQAKAGDTVRIHYTGTLQDGTVFDSSQGRDPLEFTLGAGQVIPGFDTAVSGMEVGASRTVTIPAAEAYGPRRDDMILAIPRDQVPPHIAPTVGEQLQVGQGQEQFLVTVAEVNDREVVLDGNHPLAGKDLTFALELVEIR